MRIELSKEEKDQIDNCWKINNNKEMNVFSEYLVYSVTLGIQHNCFYFIYYEMQAFWACHAPIIKID